MSPSVSLLHLRCLRSVAHRPCGQTQMQLRGRSLLGKVLVKDSARQKPASTSAAELCTSGMRPRPVLLGETRMLRHVVDARSRGWLVRVQRQAEWPATHRTRWYRRSETLRAQCPHVPNAVLQRTRLAGSAWQSSRLTSHTSPSVFFMPLSLCLEEVRAQVCQVPVSWTDC